MTDQPDDHEDVAQALREFQTAALRLGENMADMATVAARMQMLMIEDASIMIDTIKAAQSGDDQNDT